MVLARLVRTPWMEREPMTPQNDATRVSSAADAGTRPQTARSIRRWIREPLLHFLLGALLLFALERAVGSREPASDDPRTIVVDRNALLRLLQYRARRFDRRAAEAELAAMSSAEREHLVADFVREEALHREAIALGLDREDYVVRRRLAQSVELAARGIAGEASPIDDEALRAFFAERREDYRLPPTITFRHVFFAAEPNDAGAAGDRAQAALAHAHAADLATPSTTGERTAPTGDAFPFRDRYVRRSAATLERHFGPEMVDALFDRAPSDAFQGPFTSPYGAHLVHIEARDPGRLPTFDEVRGRVEEDARRVLRDTAGDAAVDAIVDRYEVELRFDEGDG